MRTSRARCCQAATLSAPQPNVAVPGFRKGKAPAQLVEKQIDQSVMQTEFMDAVINKLYVDAIDQEKCECVSAGNFCW